MFDLIKWLLQQPRIIVSLGVMTGAFFVTAVLLLRPDTSPEIIGAITGAWLATGLSTVVAFWFGTGDGEDDG